MGIATATHNKTAVIEVGGKEYKISALTIDDAGVIENAIKQKKILELRETARAAGLSGVEAADWIMSKVEDIDIMEVLASKTSMTGKAYIIGLMILQAIKRNHPNVQEHEIMPHINAGNILQYNEALNKVTMNGGREEKKEEAQA